MRASFLGVVLVAIGSVTLWSCSDDASNAQAPIGGASGASTGGTGGQGHGGAGQATAGTSSSGNPPGGASMNPSGGAAVGGVPGADGGSNAQAGDASGGEPAGAAGAGGVGGSGDACAGSPDRVVHPCGSVHDTWAPAFDVGLKRIELDTSALPLKVVSGSLHYYYSDGQAHGCGFAPAVVEGDKIHGALQIGDVVPTLVGVSLFSLVDECGTEHVFELGTQNSCNGLQWSTPATWACTARTGACVDQC